MNPTLRLISQLLVLLCIPSLSYFVLWSFSAIQEIASSGVGRLFPFQAQNPILWKLLVVWWLVGGIIGWVSLFLLYRRSQLHLSQIPRLIVLSIGVGALAALTFPPFPNKYAIAPVILSGLLLLVAWRNPVFLPQRDTHVA